MTFVERGRTALRGAFPRSVADAIVDALSIKSGCDLRDPTAWTTPSIFVQEAYPGFEPHGGATLLAEGSHHVAARILAGAAPDGLSGDELSSRLDAHPGVFDSVVEAGGAAGDVVLAHPLLFHSSSHNHGRRPRVMVQPRTDCFGPKRLSGTGLSPMEVVLARAAETLTA